MHTAKTYFSLCMSVCCEGGSKHTQASENPAVFLPSFSLYVSGLFTRACYITSAPTERETDCVGRGWTFGGYIILLSVCRPLCVCEHIRYTVYCTMVRVLGTVCAASITSTSESQQPFF